LAEYDGEMLIEDEQIEKDDKTKQDELAQHEEVLDIKLEGDAIHVTHQNLDNFKVNFYEIDLEVLFSRNPFLLNASEDFGYV